eukprot:CAMPEP_0198292418 /NCGR_PEP_ID=MMETSP1449-20131203/11985_1 /TAXON_ID=420275 /ORGANISM="Attheya septentrionalis, Strain CCMP2084" /LENGTH=1106 /DNA_ID=CAMNT_0043991451 /DNA_START=279 /DNA_END=3599 /DNA_ORIENTATION=-
MSGDNFQTQMELSELRQRIRILDNGTDRVELLDILKERDEQINLKDNQLKVLNDKFRQITDGLGQIEEERTLLRKNAEDFDKEKKKLKRHLDIREKEVMALVQRCGEQHEKVKESTLIRAENAALQGDLKKLQKRVSEVDEQIARASEREQQLKEAREDKYRIAENLSKLQRDHENVVDTLNEYILRTQTLMETQASSREEWAKESKRKAAEWEQKKLTSDESLKDLKEQIQVFDDKVSELERKYRICEGKNADLKADLEESKKGSEMEKQAILEKNSAIVAKLEKNREKEVKNMMDDFDLVKKTMREEIESSQSALVTAYNELSTKTSELQKLESEFEGLINETGDKVSQGNKEREALKYEVETLRIKVDMMSTENAELREKLSDIEDRYTSLTKQKENADKRVDTLQVEAELIPELDKKIKELMMVLKSVEEEKALVEEDNEKTLSNLRSSLESTEAEKIEILHQKQSHEVSTKKIILGLEANIEGLEKATFELQYEKDRVESELSAEVLSTKNKLEKTEVERDAQEKETDELMIESEKTIAKLSEELNIATASQSEATKMFTEQIESLKTENSIQLKQSTKKTQEDSFIIESLTKELGQKEEALRIFKNQVDKLQLASKDQSDAYRSAMENIEGELQSSISSHHELKIEMRELRDVTLKASKERVFALEDEVSRLNSDISETEIQAADVAADLEDKIGTLESSKSQLEQKLSYAEKSHERETESLSSQLQLVTDEKDSLERKVKTQHEDILAKNVKITCSIEERSALEKKNSTLQMKLDLATNEKRRTNIEHKEAISALEKEVDEERSRYEHHAKEYEEENDKLQEEISDLQNKFMEQEDHLSKMNATLAERSTLLGKMIQQNQSCEDEIKEARLLVSELQEESNEYLFQKEESDATISRQKKEMKKKNDEFVDTIQSEKKLRTLLETDLQGVTVALEKEKNKTKKFVELERENYCFKDKIQRQEAFMKKLIGKEKKGRGLERRSSSKGFDMAEMQQQQQTPPRKQQQQTPPRNQDQTPPRKSNSRSSLTSSDNHMMDFHYQSKSSLTSCEMAAAEVDMNNTGEMRSPQRMRSRSSGIPHPEMRTPPRSSRSLLSSEMRSPAR